MPSPKRGTNRAVATQGGLLFRPSFTIGPMTRAAAIALCAACGGKPASWEPRKRRRTRSFYVIWYTFSGFRPISESSLASQTWEVAVKCWNVR